MSWRRVEQGIEHLTLEIQPAVCPVCGKGLYRNITFLKGGWARCRICDQVVHYACLSGGLLLKDRPRVCLDCKAGRVRVGQQMPSPPPVSSAPPPEPVKAGAGTSSSVSSASSPS